MANICCNYITITGHPDIINLIAKDYIGYNKETDVVAFTFNLLAPIPEKLNGDDYYWRIENWGNKWDGSDCYVDLCDDQIHMSVDTAWNPCDKWTYKLIELCPGVDIYHEYYEPGEGYIGWISHTEDEDPEDFEEVCHTWSSDTYEYWLTVFEKEYETFEWLDERIDEFVDDEIISEETAKEIRTMMDDDTPLEILISKCIDDEIL